MSPPKASTSASPLSCILQMHCRAEGQWFQPESGLHQNWMRDYDPTTGRYLQADPLGLVDGASLYGYALQNPGRWTDPRGEAVTLLCRRLEGGVGDLLGLFPYGRHCAVFVHDTTCDMCFDDVEDGVIAQFSLSWGDDRFTRDKNNPTYQTDRRHWRNTNSHWGRPARYPISVPPGMTPCEFDLRMIEAGRSYIQRPYSNWFGGANSNTAAINAIRDAGGVPPTNTDAWNSGNSPN